MNIGVDKAWQNDEAIGRPPQTIARMAIALIAMAIAMMAWSGDHSFMKSLAACAGLSELEANSPAQDKRQETLRQEAAASANRDATLKTQSDPSSSLSTSVVITSAADYHIGPNDVIEIRVDKAPEISGMFRVNSAGMILVNYLGRVNTQNKTPDELAKIIADGLRDEYLKDPHVIVEVKQYNSRAFFIQGSVRNPGVYHIESAPSLMKLIIIAGGLGDTHGSTAFIIREIKPDDAQAENDQAEVAPAADASTEGKAKYELIKRNINGLLKGAFDQDIVIEPGDVVNIPPSEVFFVAGEVVAPGSFPLKEGTTIRQAISLAQGTTPSASLGHGIIFREDPISGKRQEIAVDISDIMKGKQEDIPILPNDTVIVPNSRMKSLRNALLSGFGFGMVRAGRIGRF